MLYRGIEYSIVQVLSATFGGGLRPSQAAARDAAIENAKKAIARFNQDTDGEYRDDL
jgi:hypothetical protein